MAATQSPKIKILVTTKDKIIEALGIVILICFWVFTLYYFKQLPDTIPTHFRLNGEADGFGSKASIFGLPIVATLLYVLLSFFSKYPHKMNYSVSINETNATRQYGIMVQMLRILKVCIVLVFFNLDYKTVQVVLNLKDVFGNWSIFLDFALLFIPIFYFLIKFSKNS